jgi:Zn/Cd-binding protein ZinT
MRRAFIILALAALTAHAVDCIRPMFEYFASHYRTEVLNLYILPGRMNPDSLHQQQKSQVSTIKYHWTQNHLDSLTFTHGCQDKVHRGTAKVDWKVDSARVGKLMRYDWIYPNKSNNFTVFRGKDSVAIVIDERQTHSFYIKNDTIRESNNYIPRNGIIFHDSKNENRCTRVNGKEITTYEFEKSGNTLILTITEPDYNMYIKPPGPCEGGDKYTTIFFKKNK